MHYAILARFFIIFSATNKYYAIAKARIQHIFSYMQQIYKKKLCIWVDRYQKMSYSVDIPNM